MYKSTITPHPIIMTPLTVFFPSEILQSKDLSINNIHLDYADKGPQWKLVIICHKYDSSLYKSTRKIGRTAKRLLSTVTGEEEAQNCNVYWIKTGKNEQSIQKRLDSEFSLTESFEFSIDEHVNNIAPRCDSGKWQASRFSSCVKSATPDSYKDHCNIIILDLDRLFNCASPTDANENVNKMSCWSSADKVISSLLSSSQHDSKFSSVVHIKSEILHQAVSNILASETGGISKSYVLRNDLEAYVQSAKDHFTTRWQQQPDKVIRRLRQTKGAADCPLSTYPIRYIQQDSKLIEVCRFHNYDRERGCLRSKRVRENPNTKGCEMDHRHCHLCGKVGHKALECTEMHPRNPNASLEPMVFAEIDGQLTLLSDVQQCQNVSDKMSLPSLAVLGGRLRGKTLASCEVLPLTTDASHGTWKRMPNLLEHRGSHAACSPTGSGLVFVMGGGGVDGNLDTVEFCSLGGSGNVRWQKMKGSLLSPRHAFGSVACVEKSKPDNETSVSLFAVGGWKYGSVSCESVERLSFLHPCDNLTACRWETCAPLLTPRRLHSVAASTDGTSIYVFGGFINERLKTSSIEKYDISSNQWTVCDRLPFGEHNCPLVQAIPNWSKNDNSFLIFPYGSEKDELIEVLQYTPGLENPFAPVFVQSTECNYTKGQKLHLPLKNWAAFSATTWSSELKVYLIGGTVNGKWTSRGFELDLQTMKWRELPEMLCARRRSVALIVE